MSALQKRDLGNPVRWLEQPEDYVPRELSAQLGAYAACGPSPRDIARIEQGLGVAIATGQQPRLEHRLSVFVRAAWFGVLALIMLGAGVWLMRPAPVRLVPSQASSAPLPPPAISRAQPQTAPPAPPSDAVAAREARLPRKRNAGQPRARDAVAELELLTPARRLVAAQPERALQVIAQHALRFPQGLFSEEREVLRIEALSQLGRHPELERRLRAFLRAHPGSSYRERVEEARVRR